MEEHDWHASGALALPASQLAKPGKLMRVLHLMDSAGIFGAEVMLLTLAKAQRAAGIDALIGSIQTPAMFGQKADQLAHRARALGLPVIDIVMPARALLRGRRVLAGKIKEIQPDLIHSHGYKPNILLATLQLTQRLPPTVTTLHGWTGLGGIRAMTLYEYLDRWALTKLDRIVVVSPAQLKHSALRRLPPERIYCVKNGTDLDWRNALTLRQHEAELLTDLERFAKGCRIILAIGRLAPEKGYAVLVDAFTKVAAEYTDIRLIIAGEGQLRTQLEHLAAASEIGERIRLPGYIERIDKLLEKAACLAQPSLTEGLPITVLEAMGRGIPIIATRVGGMPELLEDGMAGALIDPADAAQLTTALHNVLSNQAATQSKVGRASELFATHYSAAKMANRYQGIYKDCVGQ
jgi:glycosyltransferase involved in cell wall biosynthesis